MAKFSVNRLLLGVLLLTGVFALTEVFIRLDLTPIAMLLPQSLWLGVTAFLLLACCGILGTQLWQRKLRFSIQSLLLVCVLVAWPASRFASEISYESNRANAIQICLDSILQLKPTGECLLVGRFNHGSPNVIRRAAIVSAIQFADQNAIPHSVTSFYCVDLTGTKVNDTHLKQIAATVQVVGVLDLSHTAITDEGLESLALLNLLGELRLTGTSVTENAIQNLQRKLPNTKVVR